MRLKRESLRSPHLTTQSLGRILPTPEGLEVKTDGDLGTVSTSLPIGLEKGGGNYALSLIVGVEGVVWSQGS